ncbi:MAG: DUF1285 domain-containing protein [Candidatus Rokubacteria bacterium]|nr:DUF1285 domain-containing protein [Candidatus Rokubacteria bacterium]
MREYHYRVDRDGRIFHDGTEIVDPFVLRFFVRAMTRTAEGRYLVVCQGEKNWFEAAETPFVVQRLRLTAEAGALRSVELCLAGDLVEVLDPVGLETAGGRLFCRVRGGAFRAALGRVPMQQLAPFLIDDGTGPALVLGGVRHPISETTAVGAPDNRAPAHSHTTEGGMRRMLVAMLVTFLGAAMVAGPAGAQALDGTLKRIKETGTMRIGFRENSAPFSFLGTDRKPVGYSIDLCERIARAVQQEVQLANLNIQYVPVTVENRADMVANGTVDIECGSTTATLSRSEKVDFTSLTFIDGGGFLVSRASGIQGVTDLSGKRVAVIPGTTTERALRDELQRAGINASIVTVGDHDKGFAALQGGQADAYASDRLILVGLLIQANAAERFGIADQQFSYEPYAFMVRRNDSAFRLVANRTLARIYRSGDIGTIFGKWFAALGKPSGGLLMMYRVFAIPE